MFRSASSAPHLVRRNSVPENELGHDVLSLSKSVVKVYTTFSTPNYNQPWQLQRSSSSFSSGFIINAPNNDKTRLIVCNAHGVSNYTSVSVKIAGSRKYVAKVLCISDSQDLAILDVEDENFFRGTVPLRIGKLPAINTTIFVIGFSGGEEISFTSGTVNRCAVTSYSHSGESWLTIQTDSAIQVGNSGGPICSLEGNQYVCVGVAFETRLDVNSVSFAIAPSVIEHFLESYFTNNLGTPSINIATQPIESQIMRDSLFIPPLSGLIDYLYNTNHRPNKATPKPLPTRLPNTASLSSDDVPHESDDEKLSSLSDDDIAKIAAAAVRRGSDHSNKSSEPTRLQTRTDSSASSSSSSFSLRDSFRNRRESLPSSQVYAAQHTVVDQDEDYDYVIFHPVDPEDDVAIVGHDGTKHTPIYRFQRGKTTTQGEDYQKCSPPPELSAYLSADRVNDTSIGIRISSVVPFSSSALFLLPGDVILCVNDIPIGSDQTILLRGTERVKYLHLINGCHIGDKVTMLIARGFDILRFEVPIEDKQYVAQWHQFDTPQWFSCLGLVFVPLTSNLMASEYGSNWDQVGPVPLLASLFTGTFTRIHPDEECIVLTQILPHAANNGYDYSMRRVTHVNGERVINLKHLATLVHEAATKYQHSIGDLDQPDNIDSPYENAKDPQKPQAKAAGNASNAGNAGNAGNTGNPSNPSNQLNALPEDHLCLIDANGNQVKSGLHDQEFNTEVVPTQAAIDGVVSEMEPSKVTPIQKHANIPPHRPSPAFGSLVDVTDDDYSPYQNPVINFENEHNHSVPPCEGTRQQRLKSYQDYAELLHTEADLKYITFTLENEHKIILSLENGEENQLEVLKLHQLPIPGSSDDVVPMYDLEVNVVGAGGRNFGNIRSRHTPLATPSQSSPSYIKSPNNPTKIYHPTPIFASPSVGEATKGHPSSRAAPHIEEKKDDNENNEFPPTPKKQHQQQHPPPIHYESPLFQQQPSYLFQSHSRSAMANQPKERSLHHSLHNQHRQSEPNNANNKKSTSFGFPEKRLR